jgi:hypothetical protein
VAAWSFILADLAGRNIGRPRAFDRTFTAGVSAVSTAGWRVRQDDTVWPSLDPGLVTVKVYDSGGSLRMFGPVVADEESAQGQGANTKVTAADVAWRLAHRFVAKDVHGVGVTYTNVDSGQIALDVLAKANADAATGITAGTADAFVPRTLTYVWKRVSDALNELGSPAGSYEWQIRYTDGTPPVCQLDLRAELGSDRSSSIYLEYGAGRRNLSAYSRVRSLDQMANDVWALGASGTLAAEAYDDASRGAYGRFEDVLTFGDIAAPSLIDALAAAHVLYRSAPKQTIQATLFPATAPRYGVDYVVGDRVGLRAKIGGSVRFSGAARIWGVSIQISDLGQETPTLTLIPTV